jgi:hypothetical protein
MSYSTINSCAHDHELIGRVAAACAQEGSTAPDGAALQVVWPLAAASDVEAAYASALAAGNPSPGGDPAVITDGMILANVQAHLPPPPAP